MFSVSCFRVTPLGLLSLSPCPPGCMVLLHSLLLIEFGFMGCRWGFFRAAYPHFLVQDLVGSLDAQGILLD